MTALGARVVGRSSGRKPRPPAGAPLFRLTALVAAVAVVIATGYVVDAVSQNEVGATAPQKPVPVATEFRQSEALRLIASLEDVPARSASENTLLGRLYLQQGRYTGDIDLFRQADDVLASALEDFPTSAEALTYQAVAAASVHQFERSLSLAQQALTIDPSRLEAQLAAADALEPLGDLDGAEAGVLGVAAVVGADPAVQVRLARLAHLRGDDETALALAADAELRASDLGGFAVDVAFYHAFRANLLLDNGLYDQAESVARAAVLVSPDSGEARMVLAEVLMAQGDYAEALRQVETSLDGGIAHPEDFALLGDLHLKLGDVEEAQSFYSRVGEFEPGPVFSRQIASFYADNDVNAADALRLAEAELEVRKDIHGYDTYAWALYRNGRFSEARTASDAALAFGTREAGLLYHAGLISAALGEDDRAAAELEEALSISPQFHPIQADNARAMLDQLG